MTSVQVGTVLPVLAIAPVGRANALAYAGVSGDDNPLHIDEGFAKTVGLSGPVVHGMYIMGVMERLLRLWLERLVVRRIEVKFLRPVFHGTPFTISGRVVRMDANAMIVRILAKNSANAICCMGAAECDLP